MEFSNGSNLEFLWYTDPVFLGHYPEQGLEVLGSDVPKYTDADMAIISQPVDFCGLNLQWLSRQIPPKNGFAPISQRAFPDRL